MPAAEDTRRIAVSPRHSVSLSGDLLPLIDRAPWQDFIVRTVSRREVNGTPLIAAELVIAGHETRRSHPAAATYPFHFRKTYFPGHLRGDPAAEFAHQQLASTLTATPPPIGHEASVFRSCMVPGQSFTKLTPFGGEPIENNIAKAQKLPLASAIGLWRLAEDMLAQQLALHAGGLAHGDSELHNYMVCSAPLEALLIDFEGAVEKSSLDDAGWATRTKLDLQPLLREAIYLQCALGRQMSPLGELAWSQLPELFRSPQRFQRAIERQDEV